MVSETYLVDVCDGSDDKYRFGFNGMYKDNEMKGIGNQVDFKFRAYDTRLGRFFAVDPLTSSYPWYTPYQFAGNTPIQAIDLEGLEPVNPMTGETVYFQDNMIKGADNQWADLLEYEESSKYNRSIQLLWQTWGTKYQPQRMEDAKGVELNRDYYSVLITKLPNGYTPDELMSNIKRNFNLYLNNPDIAIFMGYTDDDEYNFSTKKYPDHTIMRFHNPMDKADVFVSTSGHNWFIFTPLYTPGISGKTKSGLRHPLAGHRQFGLTDNGDGTYTFYTRGVDYMYSSADQWYNRNGACFKQANTLWNGLMDNIVNAINDLGGEAKKTNSFSEQIPKK